MVASCSPNASVKDRALITLASVVPDIDGFGALPDLLTKNSAHPLDWFSRYHHQLHNLAFALAFAALCFLIADRRISTSLLALLSFHLHLFEDLLGGRGPDGFPWPIPYFLPFSTRQFSWSGQWALNAWPNFAITFVLLLVTFYLAWRTAHSPLEILSNRANAAFVAALRTRFPFRQTA